MLCEIKLVEIKIKGCNEQIQLTITQKAILVFAEQTTDKKILLVKNFQWKWYLINDFVFESII